MCSKLAMRLMLGGLLGLSVACASVETDPATPSSGTPRNQSQTRVADTSGSPYAPETSVLLTTTFAAPRLAVWEAVNTAWARLDLPKGTRNPSTFELGHGHLQTQRIEGHRMARYVDCGVGIHGIVANDYDVTLIIAIRVLEGDERTSKLTTTVQAIARPRGRQASNPTCESTLRLEKRIASLVGDLLGQPTGRRDDPA